MSITDISYSGIMCDTRLIYTSESYDICKYCHCINAGPNGTMYTAVYIHLKTGAAHCMSPMQSDNPDMLRP